MGPAAFSHCVQLLVPEEELELLLRIINIYICKLDFARYHLI